jgi:hypothetical protein
MKRLVLAIVALTTACSSRPEAFRASGFDPDEMAQIRSAAAEWCDATGGGYCPSVDGGENTIERVESLSGDPAARYGLIGGIGHIWVVDRSSNPDWLRYLRRSVLHEFGHAVGCRSHGPNGTVMAASEGLEADHLTPSDVQCANQ